MPHVKDYESGNILNMIRKGFALFAYLKMPLLGPLVKRYGTRALKKCDPCKVPVDVAVDLIGRSQCCAVGQRICNALHGGADSGESVFLDELAVGLVKTGKAGYVSKEAAVRTISEGRKGPIILTKVSGKHMEVCRSIPKNCIYWNSEKHGLKCLKRAGRM